MPGELKNPLVEAGRLEESKSPAADGGNLKRQDTFTPPGRANTFSRSDTFGAGAEPFRRMSTGFGALTRTLTEIGNTFDPDGEFTKAVIEDYVEHAQPAQEGEMPLPAGFARKAKFWKILFLGGVCSIIIASLAALFINMVDNMPEKWATCSYDDDHNCGDYYSGEKWWIIVTSLTGLGIGIFRWATSYPQHLPGLFREVLDMHVDWHWTPHTYLISMASLCGGATLGPEQALGNMSGGIACFVIDHIPHPEWWFEEEDYKGLFVLGAMASALGALLNTPLLGASMLHELGDPPRTFMESFVYFGIMSTIAFAMYYCWCTNTWIDHQDANLVITEEWLHNGGYKNWMVVTSFLMGCVSAGICLVCAVTMGVFRQVFNRIREKLAFNKFLVEVVPPLIGGIAVGCINWALPATVGNGSMLIPFFIKFGGNGSFNKSQLLATGFARIFLFGVCTQCGFIGGLIFPLLSIATIAGVLCYQYLDFLDFGFCVTTFMVAVPMGIVPMPVTFVLLISFTYFLGFYQSVPLFVAGLTSYTVLCGSGFFKKLAAKPDEQQRRDEMKKDKDNGTDEKGGAGTTPGHLQKRVGSGGEEDDVRLSSIKESESSSVQSGIPFTGGAGKSISSRKGSTTIEEISQQKMQAKKEADEFAVNAYLPTKRGLPQAEP